MSRETFLARVRQAAQAGRAYRVHLRDVPAGVGYVGPAQPDLCVSLADEINAVGGVAQVCDDDDAARAALEELLRRYEPRTALCWQHETLESLKIGELLARRGVAASSYDQLANVEADSRRETLFAADIGITSVEWAIAETGTLVMWAKPGRERVASLLPPVHVALVRQSQIVPDLFDVFAKVHAGGLSNMPSHLTLITGPSKTGDIELQLTTGVHGPGKWHVLIVRE